MGAFQRRLVFTSPTSIRYLLSYVLFLCLGTIFFVLLPMEERRTGLVRDFRPSTWAVLREYGFTEAAVAAMPSQYVPNVVVSVSWIEISFFGHLDWSLGCFPFHFVPTRSAPFLRAVPAGQKWNWLRKQHHCSEQARIP